MHAATRQPVIRPAMALRCLRKILQKGVGLGLVDE
jgi:hypothetical protein